MNFRARKRREPQVVIVSLIDVVLQLVIFLLLTTTFKAGGGAVDVNLPEAGADRPPHGRGLVLDMDRHGNVSVGGKSIEAEVLGEALRKAAGEKKRQEVVIRADRMVAHGEVVDLMDFARRNDVRSLAVAAVEANPEDPGENPSGGVSPGN